jgi:Ca-activated chloride channel family protein
MSNWADIVWTHPAWGWLALQPLLMAALLKWRRQQILHYADAHLLAWVVGNHAALAQSRWRDFLNLMAWACLAAALAGPRLPLQSLAGQQSRLQHELDIMVLLDVSPSMYAQDISPQRLQRAKLELMDILPRLHGERLGLVAYSGSAGLLMPLNRDYAALPYYLNIAEPALFSAPGTALASALDLALRHMPETSSAHRAILVLTDAETSALSGPAGAAVWEVADKLKQAQVPVYILGVGSEAGSVITLPDGNTVVYEGADVLSRMDSDGFSELAKRTGGQFVEVSDGDSDSRALYDSGLLNVPGGKTRAESVEAWQEMYAIFLLPALLLFMVLTIPFKVKRWLPVLSIFILLPFTSLSGHEAYASELDAYTAYHQNNHALAQTLYADVQGYAGRMGEGAAAYRRKDYQYAIKQFSSALLQARTDAHREPALFNLANSYFLAGAYLPAADAYLGVLRYAPDNQDARANLALAAGQLASQSQSAKNSKGVLGRRGREVGGALGEDVGDQSLAMEADKDKKPQRSIKTQDADYIELLKSMGAQGEMTRSSQYTEIEHDIVYRVAQKKMELVLDQPLTLHKALIKIEAEREYVPLPEMMPW